MKESIVLVVLGLVMAMASDISLAGCDQCLAVVRGSSQWSEQMTTRAMQCASSFGSACVAAVSKEIFEKFRVIVDWRLVPQGGGLDLDAYCRAKGYTGVSLEENNAHGWKCRDSGGGLHGMDLYDACAWQYGRGRPIYGDFNDPCSWKCVFE